MLIFASNFTAYGETLKTALNLVFFPQTNASPHLSRELQRMMCCGNGIFIARKTISIDTKTKCKHLYAVETLFFESLWLFCPNVSTIFTLARPHKYSTKWESKVPTSKVCGKGFMHRLFSSSQSKVYCKLHKVRHKSTGRWEHWDSSVSPRIFVP